MHQLRILKLQLLTQLRELSLILASYKVALYFLLLEHMLQFLNVSITVLILFSLKNFILFVQSLIPFSHFLILT